MDENSRFNLEIRIVAPNCRGSWYGLDKVVDADFTNFKDFVDEVVDIYPPSFGHIVRVFYFRMDTKTNIQVCSDQDLVEMFAKHKASKCCYLTFCYYSPAIEAPFTPSVPCPSIAKPSLETHTQSAETINMPNPNPVNEHVEINDEGLYIDIGPKYPKPTNPEASPSDTCSDSDGVDESSSDEEYEIEDIDEVVKDKDPARKPEMNYDKKDPPMAVKTNPYPPEQCHNTRRAGACVGMTQFWVHGNLGSKELKRKLKEHHKVDVSYRKVYIGNQLAM
ncbi:hypothetical protein PVAP13_7NG350824 [Panicum virgatum]|uniref:Uncharacterized protein n=1 Tax=Panicum virgatum TaxID=38727 RepID=A0A8T0QAQ3_PANVG|nr:hypothetical protein PVAP13_7NG350824 [Panicum virgatum]